MKRATNLKQKNVDDKQKNVDDSVSIMDVPKYYSVVWSEITIIEDQNSKKHNCKAVYSNNVGP